MIMDGQKKELKTLLETKFLNVYDLEHQKGAHYYIATRNKKEHMVLARPDEEFADLCPDAVTLCVVLRMEDADRLLLFYEFRYPTGHFLLSPPAGLIEAEDRDRKDGILQTAIRELHEETGIVFKDGDEIRLLNPCLFSTPGMTDETNAMVLLLIDHPDTTTLTDRYCEGTEIFDGFYLLDKEEALSCIRTGKDPKGNPYSAYTLLTLLFFVSDLWRA